MTERMTIAKTEITMQDHACITPTTGFILVGIICERCQRV